MELTRCASVLFAGGILIVACGGAEPPPPATPSSAREGASPASSLEVPIAAKSGSTLTGKVVFTELPEGVRAVIDVAGIPPGKHAAHVHEKGDCSSPDAKSAGEHYSPDGHPHGLPPAEPRHLGDFGSIDVGNDGKGHLEITVARANLRANDPHSYVGRAIVVHAKPDDGGQPSGNAGERIGCGEIRR